MKPGGREGHPKLSVCVVASLLPLRTREVCFCRDSPGAVAVPQPPQNRLFKGQKRGILTSWLPFLIGQVTSLVINCSLLVLLSAVPAKAGSERRPWAECEMCGASAGVGMTAVAGVKVGWGD